MKIGILLQRPLLTWFPRPCTKRGLSKPKFITRFGPYFVEPVIAGLEPNGTPFIASTDLIGCINFAKDFVVSGTASNMMYGMCESLWEPNLVILAC
jgi:20S proteasome subunit beta 3